ncbi:MAG: hypothetical protein LBJ95_01605 [Oscillospiraceae bacterium]|jgi:hypothetical protein|nr:hypothetical protein [Oscillospiraceae bacterium]
MKLAKRLLPLLLSFGMVFTISSFNSIKVKANVNPVFAAARANPDAFFNDPNIPFDAKIEVVVALLSDHPSSDVLRKIALFLNTASNDPNQIEH